MAPRPHLDRYDGEITPRTQAKAEEREGSPVQSNSLWLYRASLSLCSRSDGRYNLLVFLDALGGAVRAVKIYFRRLWRLRCRGLGFAFCHVGLRY